VTALVMAIGSVASAALGWVVGPSVAAWALGAGYEAAGGLLGPFLLIAGLILAPTAYEQLLLISGQRWAMALANWCAGLFLVLAVVPGAIVWGVDGAVAATAAAWAIRAAILIGWSEAELGRGHPSRIPATGR